jgi:hypothetical protein
MNSSPLSASTASVAESSDSKLTKAKPGGLNATHTCSHFPYLLNKSSRCSRFTSSEIPPTYKRVFAISTFDVDELIVVLGMMLIVVEGG